MVVDRHNDKNSFGLALGLGVLFAFSRAVGIPDLFYVAAWLVLLLRLLTWHYNLTLLGAVLVTASTIFSPYLLVPLIMKFVGTSPLRDYLVLYGFPGVVLGVWVSMKVRGFRAKADADGTIPAARIARGGRERAATNDPIAAPTPIAAPKPADPPRTDGQPTFLS